MTIVHLKMAYIFLTIKTLQSILGLQSQALKKCNSKAVVVILISGRAFDPFWGVGGMCS